MVDQEVVKDLEIFTKTIMENEEILEYDLHIKGQTEKGTNYGSEIVFFNVTPKNSGKKYNFVMKTAKRSDEFRKAAQDGIADRRETFMYSQVFPTLLKMLQEFKCPFQLENISKVHLVHKQPRHETIIMDNLKSLGYRLWDMKKPMNLEHIRTVVSTYGKYHASSMALHYNKPEIFHEFSKELTNIWEYFQDNATFKPMFIQYVTDALNILHEAGLSDIAEKLKGKGLPEKTTVFARKLDEEDKIVITHGDCWNNNIMFKYKDLESSNPTGVCFLDFQLSSLKSPVNDLSYFLYTACDAQTLTDEFDNLLNLYYQSLSSTLRSLNVDPEKALTKDKLKEHWKKYALEGLLMASMVIKIQLSNKDETMDLTDVGKEGVDYTKFMIKDIADGEGYKNRIIGVYKHYAATCL